MNMPVLDLGSKDALWALRPWFKNRRSAKRVKMWWRRGAQQPPFDLFNKHELRVLTVAEIILS